MVYLLHFDRPYRHARHYVGFTTDLKRRLEWHRLGKSAALMTAIKNAGIGFTVARVWHNVTVAFERRISRTSIKRWCPLCAGRNKVLPGRPKISDYQDSAYEEYPENLEYDGHWEYQPRDKL